MSIIPTLGPKVCKPCLRWGYLDSQGYSWSPDHPSFSLILSLFGARGCMAGGSSSLRFKVPKYVVSMVFVLGIVSTVWDICFIFGYLDPFGLAL